MSGLIVENCGDAEGVMMVRGNLGEDYYVTTDGLFTRLQCQTVGRVPGGVLRYTHQTTGHLARVLLVRGQEGGVRSTEAHRTAKALRRTQGDVSAELAGRRQQGQRQQVGGHDGQCTDCVQLFDALRIVEYVTLCAGVLEQGSTQRVEVRSHVGFAAGDPSAAGLV